MRYVMGLEDGHNSITAVVAEETGCLLGMGQAHFPHAVPIEEAERLRQGVSNAVRDALVMADLEKTRMAVVYVAGNSTIEALKPLYASLIPSDCVVLGEETRLALTSVTLGRPGVVVIAGAGARAFGINAEGTTAASGGWGLLPGDEGSEPWIALRALNSCYRAADGIGPRTEILPLLLNHLEAPDLAYIHQRVASGSLSRADSAVLVEVVIRAGAQGDITARAILRDAGRELALLVHATLMKLEMTDLPVIVGTVGGVFRVGRRLLKTFRETVLRIAPAAVITAPQVPPSVAAALLALEEIGLPLQEERIARMEATWMRMNVGKL